MSGHDELLRTVQDIANLCYHADRDPKNDPLYRQGFDYALDQVACRIKEPLSAILAEIGERMERLGQLEVEHKDATAAEHMRKITWFVAATEIAMFMEANFTFEPIETRVPEQAATLPKDTRESAQEIFDAVVRMRDAGQPHPDYVFEYDQGILRGVSKRVQKTSRGVRNSRRAVLSEMAEEALIRERAEFGARVRAERKAYKVKRKYLASWVGVPKETIRMLERGELTHFGGGAVSRNNYIVEQVAHGVSSTVDILWPTVAGNEENK